MRLRGIGVLLGGLWGDLWSDGEGFLGAADRWLLRWVENFGTIEAECQ